jgi:hypothetical protein
MLRPEYNPDELDALIAAGAFADDDAAFHVSYREWLDDTADEQYAEYQMKKIAEQYGEDL